MQSNLSTLSAGRDIHHLPVKTKNTLLLLASVALITVCFIRFNWQSTLLGNTNNSNSTHTLPPAVNDAAGVTSTASVSQIVTDALAFSSLLNTSQQATLNLSYTTTLAKKWSNLPCGTSCRNGLQLGTNLSAEQYAAAMQVIKDALSTNANDGYDEFHQMNLAEAYLHANGGANGYDSTLRWIAFLNTPSETGPWMLQFGGHHYAANISFNNGHIIGATPFFMGLEPKTFTYNGVTYDPLGEERNAFANLFASLSSTELAAAHLTSSFSDCAMIPGESNGGTGTFPATPVGISCGSLTTTQQNLVLEVISHYVNDMDPTTAAAIMDVYTSEIAETYIAYTGNGTSGNPSSFLNAQGNYVRIDGPTVWVEFSCQGGIVIQNQIHYHTVWRDQQHDYGVNLTGAAIDGNGTTGLAEMGKIKAITLFPNPASDKISFSLNNDLKNATVIIINTGTGQLVKQPEQFNGQHFTSDISTIAAGNYVLKVKANDGTTYVGKFSKK